MHLVFGPTLRRENVSEQKTLFLHYLITDYVGLPLVRLLHHSRVIGCTGWVVFWSTYHNSGAGQSQTEEKQTQFFLVLSTTSGTQLL